MRILPAIAASFAGFLLVAHARSAQADAPTEAESGIPATPKRGVEVGLRTGYGAAFGALEAKDWAGDTVSEGRPMKDLAGAQVPLWIDLGYRLDDRFAVGAYFDYGFVTRSGALCNASDCSTQVRDLHFGVTTRLNVSTREGGPHAYVGLGLGYENLHYQGSSYGRRYVYDGSAHGLEIGPLQLGVDFALSSKIDVGPFVAATLGMYLWRTASIASLSPSDLGRDGPIHDPALHVWTMFGIAGRVRL
jgi:hypothetical protein